jgi:hypothetical protein
MALFITGFFDDDEAARKVVRDLEAASIPFGDISITSGKAVERWSSSLLPTAQGGRASREPVPQLEA